MNVNVIVSEDRLKDLLCSALEGGSNYWYTIEDYQFPSGVVYEDFRECGKFTDPDNYRHPCNIIPFHDGCGLIISDEDQKTVLDRAAIEKGIKLMAENQPEHFADFTNENDDADTGDVFLQLCLFGEIVYG